MMEENKHQIHQGDASGTTTGNYIQTYGANGATVFVIGSEIYSGLDQLNLMSPVLTKHLPLEAPVQISLRSRANVKALYTACLRFLEATEKFEKK